MQLKSVRDWDMVAALFELLWEEKARRIALRLVSHLSNNPSLQPPISEDAVCWKAIYPVTVSAERPATICC